MIYSKTGDVNMNMDLKEIIEKQRKYFSEGNTLSVKFRKEMLLKLYQAVKIYEKNICGALYEDLGKSAYEAFMCEAGLALTEISYMIKHIKKFTRARRVRTPLAQFASKSYEISVPYGNVLIMSPWNYPFLLTVEPLAAAIAAGNTAIIKPSAYSPATSALIAKIIAEIFPPQYVTAVTGGRRENSALLDEKFDFIFFTGSQGVGKEVLHRAAEHLTPTVLELGGKSPCIVDGSAKIRIAAKRIVFGKFLNCGQTCVAPDYVLCERSVKDELVSEIASQIKAQYGNNPIENSDYGRIVNEKHFDRILSLIDTEKTVVGGSHDRGRLKIEPTVMDKVDWNDAVMKEEIFGPVLPVLTYEKFEDVFEILRDKEKPLALYLFSEDKKHIKEVIERIRYGGGCINDTVIHLATSELGFGGVGESGMGRYHGKSGFDAFSHKKSIVDKKTLIDLPMRYQPYKSRFYERLVHFFLK
jgi:aldehyde dehydrogenase (NAD+)